MPNHFNKAMAWLIIASNAKEDAVKSFALDKFEQHAVQAGL